MQKLLIFVRKYKYTSGILGIIALFIVASVTLFFMGYRIGPGFSIMPAGTLIISDLKQGASVYIDDGYNGQATNPEMRVLLTPGSHRVIVSATDDQPWVEIFQIEAGKDFAVRPIFVAKVSVVKLLAKAAQIEAKDFIRSYTLPTSSAPLKMKSGCALVYTDLGRIVAVGTTTATCTAPPYLCQNGVCNPTIIFSPSETLASIVSFPGRDDVLVVGAGARVFVLELDPRTPQFFSPVIHAENAVALPWSDHSIVVSSDEGVREVPL